MYYQTRKLGVGGHKVEITGEDMFKWDHREFPGGSVVRTPHLQCRGNGFWELNRITKGLENENRMLSRKENEMGCVQDMK